MFGDRLKGTIIGMCIAFVPVINLFVCAVLSFMRRKILQGVLFLVLTVAVIIGFFKLGNADAKKALAIAAWERGYHRDIDEANLDGNFLYDGELFQKTMLEILEKTNDRMLRQGTRWKGVFKKDAGRRITFSEDTYEIFPVTCQHIREFYWKMVTQQTGDDKVRTIPFGKTKAEEYYITEQLNIFFKAYIGNFYKRGEDISAGIIGIGVLIGFIASIALGRKMYDKPENIAATGVYTRTNSSFTYSWTNSSGEESVTTTNTIREDRVTPTVNVNTADENTLAGLPGINQVLAKGIIAERARNGYFTDVFDLQARMEFREGMINDLVLVTSFLVDRQPTDNTPPPAPDADQQKKENNNNSGKGRRIEF